MAKHQKWRFDVQAIGGNVEDEKGNESARVRDDGKELRLHLKTISECNLDTKAGNRREFFTRRIVKFINKCRQKRAYRRKRQGYPNVDQREKIQLGVFKGNQHLHPIETGSDSVVSYSESAVSFSYKSPPVPYF